MIKQVIYDGILDKLHHGGRLVRRLLVDGLVITVDAGTVHAYRGDVGDDFSLIGNITVSDDVLSAAKAVADSREALQEVKDEVLFLMDAAHFAGADGDGDGTNE